MAQDGRLSALSAPPRSTGPRPVRIMSLRPVKRFSGWYSNKARGMRKKAAAAAAASAHAPPRAPPGGKAFVYDPDGDSQADPDAPRELTFVPEDAIWAEF